MAQRSNTWWQRNKFKLNALVLILPFWFLYDSLSPVFPPSWSTQKVGAFEVTPTPLTNDAPYQHHGDWVKDFSLQFCEGCVANIRQAYMAIAAEQPAIEAFAEADLSILHGSSFAQHVHAKASAQPKAGDKVWLLIEDWQGQLHVGSWDWPQS